MEKGLSPEQFIEFERVKMLAEVCGPNAKTSCTFIQNGVAPVYNLGK